MSLFLPLPQKQRKKVLIEAPKGFELHCERGYGFRTSELSCVTEDTEKISLVHEMYVVIWIEKEVQRYLGFVCKDIGDNKYIVKTDKKPVY